MSTIQIRSVHFIKKCSCGIVISQCRCPGPKSETILPHPACQQTLQSMPGRVQPPPAPPAQTETAADVDDQQHDVQCSTCESDLPRGTQLLEIEMNGDQHHMCGVCGSTEAGSILAYPLQYSYGLRTAIRVQCQIANHILEHIQAR